MPPKKPTPRNDELFRSRLDNMIDMGHALVKLARLIDWSWFDDAYGRFYHEKGRPGLSTRLMAGLHLLKHMEGLSDEAVCARWVENPYFQYFCGEQYFRHKLPLDRSSMKRWRGRISADKLELLLAEMLRIAMETRAMPPQACERVTVDTTVQTKAVAHPTDSHLLMRGIEWLNRLARKHGLKLRQSFLRVGRQARRDVSRLIHGRGHKQAMRWVRKLRTWLGRLDRDIGRKIVGNEELEAAFAVARERVANILIQKVGSTDKLYALHAPEVECIAKGKARTRYEFGVKTSIAVTNARTGGGQFIVGMQALPGNPYDGHTLSGQIEQVERLTGITVERAYVDRGYKGHKHGGKAKVYIAHTRGIASPMPTECSAKSFEFARVESRAVVAAFDGGAVTSDAGRLLLGATDRAIRLVDRFAGCFTDHRRSDLIEHEVRTLVSQRIFGIALGYEDLNDHDELRHNPVMATLVGKLEAGRRDCAPLAGKSTLNRLELSRSEPTRYHKISHDPEAIEGLFVRLFLETHKKGAEADHP